MSTFGINQTSNNGMFKRIKERGPIGDYLRNRIIVNQSNFKTTLGGVIDSSKEYFLDGIINIGSLQITVPSSGIYITGYNFDISGLVSSEDNYTMFISESEQIGSGNFLGADYFITVSGIDSKVYELYDTTSYNAIEFSRVNYNDCTSLGDLHNYRQGLELGTGRFGGSPSLTLHGTWNGGFRITTSIVRNLNDSMVSPLFKAGVSFVMNSRFLSDINCDLPALAPLCDFSSVNLPNASTLQIQNAIITRNGIFDPTDPNIFTNIFPTDLSSFFKNNVGVSNTHVGGIITFSSEITTVISTIGNFEVLLGTTVLSSEEHVDSQSDGSIRNLGETPRQFEIYGNVNIDCRPNRDIILKFRKFDNSEGVFLDLDHTRQKRTVNNLVGGRDLAFFNLSVSIELDINDYVFLIVSNETDTSNVIAEEGSYFRLKEM